MPAAKKKTKPVAKKKAKPSAEAELRKFALSLPGAVEEFPWGDRVMKVNKKVFVFMGSHDGGDFGLSVKLLRSGEIALALPFASPTRYGLGKSGWVSARFSAKEKPPVPMLKEWIEESYRAIAPVKLLAQLDARDKSPR